MHKWADMARFAESAVKQTQLQLNSAVSGRDKVAICGYHGWHDWYLATNLTDSSSPDTHLLPGLAPKGKWFKRNNISIRI